MSAAADDRAAAAGWDTTPAPEGEPVPAGDGRSFEDMLADPHEQFDGRSELLASIAAYAAAPQASAGIQPPRAHVPGLGTACDGAHEPGPCPPSAPAPEAATPPRQLAARMDGDAARYREQADRASQAANVVALNYAAGRSDGLLAAASDVITVLAPAWDALAARDAESAAEAQDWARRCADALAERDELRDEYEAMRARFAGMHPPCPGGCGCAIGTDDADARECACDGPCCETFASVAAERDKAQRSASLLAKIVSDNAYVMEAARIEMFHGDPYAAAQWILNAIPDQWDDQETAWDGAETAQAWFDRARAVLEARAAPGGAPGE